MRPAPTPPDLNDLIGLTLPLFSRSQDLIDLLSASSDGYQLAMIYNGLYLLITNVEDQFSLQLAAYGENSLYMFLFEHVADGISLTELIELEPVESLESVLVDLLSDFEGQIEVDSISTMTYSGIVPTRALEI